NSVPSLGVTMSNTSSPISAMQRPLLLWPGVIIVAALWALFEMLPRLELESRQFLFFFKWGAMGLIGAFVVWWLFLSRTPWLDRIGALLLCLPAGAAIWPFTHISVGRYGALLYVGYAIPVVLAAWVLWLVATPVLRWRPRRNGLLLVI